MGEINKYDTFGKSIIDTVKKYNIKKILEIGSWDGTGSTQCFIEGMKDFDEKELICLEVYADRFEGLKQNTSQYNWVRCHNQSSISYKNFLYKNFDDIWFSPYNNIPKVDGNGSRKELINKWYTDDVAVMNKFNSGYLEDNENETYDGVLIDGGEFAGYSEFVLLKDRSKFFFLDDCTRAFKTTQVALTLLNDDDWSLIVDGKDERNGFAIFGRKEFL